ncbi:MAG: hypothetical protein ACQEXJ_05270 [Myxococcota bacterium]
MKPEIPLAVTIDTEADAWDPTREPHTTANLRRVPGTQRMLRDLGVRPTWLLTWEAATDDWAAGLFREIHASGEAEIGAHLHPWTSPPVDEPLEPVRTMMCNLPVALQREKLRRLTDAIGEVRGGEPPTVFRAGRWGLGRSSVEALIDCGYSVDTSVTPWISWEGEHGPSFVGAPEHVYRVGPTHDPTVPDDEGAVVEVPVTSGFNRRPFARASQADGLLRRGPLKHLHAAGIAHRARVLRRIFLSPETADDRDMLILARHHVEMGVSHLNMMFHSESLLPGLSPFVRTEADAEAFQERIRRFVRGLTDFASIRFATVSEIAGVAAPGR